MEHWTVAGDGLAPPLPSLGSASATRLLAVAALALVTRPVRASTSAQISPFSSTSLNWPRRTSSTVRTR